jgi:hypothetical protein
MSSTSIPDKLSDSTEIITPAKVIKNRVAVIDDAFDNVEKGEVSISDYLEFYKTVNDNGEFDLLLAEFDLTAPQLEADDEQSDEFIAFLQKLWNYRDEPKLSILKEAQLFSDKFSKLSDLEKICKNLENLHLSVERINSKVEDLKIFNSGEFIFVFMDFNLGFKPGPEAIKNAQNKVKAIYESCPEDSKPITILMSSMPEVAKQKDTFQLDSDMLEGVFRFSPKNALISSNKSKLLIRAYKDEFTSNHALQNYINALTAAAIDALEKFKTEVRMMRIDDYVFIQNSALLEQAQPLGDYLAWLYGSHWANLLLGNSNLKTQQSIIDRVLSRTPPLHHEVPSPKVSDIYMSALFEDELSPISYHPLEPEGKLTNNPTSALAKLPYLHLGDLFTKPGENIVWMVLNAQCDLERANEENKKRSIFLVPGTLHLLQKSPLISNYKTEFFKFNGVQYRISWEVKNVLSIPHDEFEGWQKKTLYERRHRLRLPFALEIQQAFSASVTRVGLPVSPPFTQDLKLEVLFKEADGSASVLLSSSTEFAFQPVTRKEDKFVRLTLGFALALNEALDSKKEKLQKELELQATTLSTRTSESFKHLTEAILTIDKILNKFEDSFYDKKGFNYPEAGKVSEAFKGYISVAADVQKNSFPTSAKSFILFNIITTTTPEIESVDIVVPNEPAA